MPRDKRARARARARSKVEGALKEAFDHDKLDAYCVAIEFRSTASTIAESPPQGRAYIVEQLNRAVLSMCANA